MNWLKRWQMGRYSVPPLLTLSSGDEIALHQIYEGALIVGATGSGKTSGPGDALARALLREGAGFLVLCAKPDECARWGRLCQEAGRGADLRRIGPGSPLKCDILNYTLSHPDSSVEDAAQLLDTLVDVANRKGAQGDEQFWLLFLQRIIRQMISLVWLGKQRASISDLYRVITSAPSSPEEVGSAEWRRSSFCAECLFDAAAKAEVLPQQDLGLCASFFTQEWPRLSEKTRSIGYTMATNILEKFLTGPVAEVVSSGVTNFTPDEIADGRVVVLDMPYLKWRDPGRFMQIMFKLLVQRSVLRRDASGDAKPVVIWQDEAQLFLTEQDIEVQTVARQSRLVNVVLTQSLPVMQEALGGGQRAEQQVQALIGNLQTKFVCQQSDTATNEFFSALLGKSKHLFMNGSMPTGDYDFVGDMFGIQPEQRGSAGFSEQWHPDVPPETFTHLRKGGTQSGLIVDAICFMGGKRLSNGKTWVKASFRQKQ